MEDVSEFQQYRYQYKPSVAPGVMAKSVKFVSEGKTEAMDCKESIAKLFPHTYGQDVLRMEVSDEDRQYEPINVGVIFSGGQAPGGHNVISGLFDRLKQFNGASRLIGFRKGPDGLIKNDAMEITKEIVDQYRNTGGFNMLTSGRTKIETEADFQAVEKTVAANNLNALVIIGGDDSNTNAALIAEHFLDKKIPCNVFGIPKTIDRDLMSPKGLETSFGFDSATKVYAEMIANICRDCLSAVKYWHFIRLMGRSASHITLECALQTHPNITLIGEQIQRDGIKLPELVKQIAAVITSRIDKGKNYGICLVPEGLIEFVPGISELIRSLSDVLAQNKGKGLDTSDHVAISELLNEEQRKLFMYLPSSIRSQLLLDRDPHGNVMVSQIETEKLLIELLKKELSQMESPNGFKYSSRFTPLSHFMGYEGRCAAPSNFDASYCYSLGACGAVLCASRKLTGYMAVLTGLADRDSSKWVPRALPITSLMTVEHRAGTDKPVIEKQLVNLEGKPYTFLKDHMKEWAEKDCFRDPGPIQHYYGEDPLLRRVADRPALCLLLESGAQ